MTADTDETRQPRGGSVRRAFNVAVILPMVAATYRAWGRCWLTDDQCRAIVTALLRVGLIGHRPAATEPRR